MPDVWYTCPFVPPEWIAAHGLRPRRMHLSAPAHAGTRATTEGMCPYADAFVAVNGRPSARLIDPSVDLSAVEDGLAPKVWILPAPEGLR